MSSIMSNEKMKKCFSTEIRRAEKEKSFFLFEREHQINFYTIEADNLEFFSLSRLSIDLKTS